MDLNRYRLPGLEKKFSREPRNKAFLVILQTSGPSRSEFEEDLQELSELASAALMRVVGHVFAKVPHPSPSHFLREGKLTEVRDAARAAGANVIVLNVDLSPTQGGNIQMFTGIGVMDRTGLILDIFGRRAKSREGKLQVELAQLTYSLPRIGGLGTVMSRLGGGIGSRGPGEQELEKDRRKIRSRIQRVKEELKDVRKHRQLIRAGRKRKRFASVALIGYTNAGKSTLLNALTGAESYVEDKMFATLDPVTRLQSINGRDDILFVDTVGFIKDLPHGLVESFHATLEEVTEADVLIHVLDVSHAHAEDFKKSVERVLDELKISNKPILLAMNKADLLTEEQKTWALEHWPEGILISAKNKLGLNGLMTKIENFVGHQDDNSLEKV